MGASDRNHMGPPRPTVADSALSEWKRARTAAEIKKLTNATPSRLQHIVVAINAAKKIRKDSLEWTLSNVAQSGSRITLLAVIPGYSAIWSFWARMGAECYVSIHGKASENEADITETCLEMLQQLNDRCVEKKVQVNVKMLMMPGKGAIATEAQTLNASLVVLDKNMKKEEKSCLAQLQCNLVIVHNSQNAKFLRMSLKQENPLTNSAEADSSSELLPGLSFANLPPGFDGIMSSINSSFRPIHSKKTEDSNPDTGMSSTPFTASDLGTSPLSSTSSSDGSNFPYKMNNSSSSASDFEAELARPSSEINSKKLYEKASYADNRRRDTTLGEGDQKISSRSGIDIHNSNRGWKTSEQIKAETSSSIRSTLYDGSISRRYNKSNRSEATVRKGGEHSSTESSALALVPYEGSEISQSSPSESLISQLMRSPISSSYEDRASGSGRKSGEDWKESSREELGTSLQGSTTTNGRRNFKTRVGTDTAGWKETLSTRRTGSVMGNGEFSGGRKELGKGPSSSSKSSNSGNVARKGATSPPPLCSVCNHRAPEFGRSAIIFTYEELRVATRDFSEETFLAEGGFGWVHKGVLPDGQMIAVKQLKAASTQGDKEFCSEVEVLSCAQHRNVVMLIGHCMESGRRILVYEFVCNGSLASHLSDSSNPPLEWTYRQKVAVGAARGLRFLHEDCRVGCIVHRDLRPSNILLTHDYEPLVADFGLARCQHPGQLDVETRVIGTFGYLAPEYVESGQLTEKADLYAFGVILLELITGRKAIDIDRPRGQHSLLEWARPLMEDNAVDELIDPRLEGMYSEYEVNCMLHAASLCLNRDADCRPRMSQVLKILEGDLLGTPTPFNCARNIGRSGSEKGSFASSNRTVRRQLPFADQFGHDDPLTLPRLPLNSLRSSATSTGSVSLRYSTNSSPNTTRPSSPNSSSHVSQKIYNQGFDLPIQTNKQEKLSWQQYGSCRSTGSSRFPRQMQNRKYTNYDESEENYPTTITRCGSTSSAPDPFGHSCEQSPRVSFRSGDNISVLYSNSSSSHDPHRPPRMPLQSTYRPPDINGKLSKGILVKTHLSRHRACN